MDKTVLVTGSTTYIGVHAVLELLNAGYRVIAQGTPKSNNSVQMLPKCLMHVLILSKCKGSLLEYCPCDLLDINETETLFQNQKFSTIVHLSSSNEGIAESIIAPLECYENNVVASINLLKMCEKYNKKNIIFASSSCVYDVPYELPLSEQCKTGNYITNPYGWSKHAVEQLLQESNKIWKANVIVLRIFNTAGAHPSGLLGMETSGSKKLMPLIASAALGKISAIPIYGNSYPTRDGTCSQDFVHVVDVARAILCSTDRMNTIIKNGNGCIEIYNIGSGQDLTVLEMVSEYERVCEKKIKTIICSRRPRDMASIYCDITMAQQNLNWSPTYGIGQICQHLHKWSITCPNGYQ